MFSVHILFSFIQQIFQLFRTNLFQLLLLLILLVNTCFLIIHKNIISLIFHFLLIFLVNLLLFLKFILSWTNILIRQTLRLHSHMLFFPSFLLIPTNIINIIIQDIIILFKMSQQLFFYQTNPSLTEKHNNQSILITICIKHYV